ncbi:EAL domain-containing protein [Chitinibacter sp. SCUT-21]|uniref:putative bifunctional diguanylate cyclase/phosphodiesterase n=1 Tax=Chitinibacter sp. SCUT-21 TaxID=2970891 RepID=UPI0035A67C90
MSQLFYEKIGLRIALGFLTLIIVIIGFSGLIAYQAHLSYRELEKQLTQDHERYEAVMQLEYQIAQLRRAEKNLMLNLNLPSMVAENIREWTVAKTALQQRLIKLGQLLGQNNAKDLHIIRENLARYQDGILILIDHIQHQKFENSADANRSFTPYKSFIYNLESTISKLSVASEQRELSSIQQLDDLRQHRLIQLAFVSSCLIIFCALLAYSVTRKSLQIGRQFAYQTDHDTLTGLLNRRGFARTLSLAQHQQGALLYLDLDQFRLINDLCGHSAGDDLLRLLGHRFAALVERSAGVLAHIEGDEFAIFLPQQDTQSAQSFAEILQQQVQAIPFIWQNRNFALNIAVGIAIKESDSQFHELLLRAHTACSIAKERGQGQIAHAIEFDQRHQQLQQDMSWAAKLPEMLEQNRFVLFYQQMLALQDTAELEPHAEILVRGLDEQGKVVPPGLFLPAAERFNVINRIDRWVSQTFLNQILPEKVVFGINLSAASLADERFLETLLMWIKQSAVPAEQLCFEITETAAMTEMKAASHFITSLKALGCRFALDDFGSGFSSFSYLKDLPVDYLKIDGSLIRNIENNRADEVMVTAIVQMAKSLELKVIAEFVENNQQIEILRRLGVDYAQGFGVHKPEILPSQLTQSETPSGVSASI